MRVLDGKTGHAGLEIETAGCRDLPVIRAANRKVRQVLFNVLANAIKFSPRGGIISIRGDRAGAGGAALRVSDTGIGMSAEDIDTALSLFGQVASGMDRDYQGVGLGLALCKSIMEGHGGTLDIESELGVGTIVTLNFPHERGYGPRHGLGT